MGVTIPIIHIKDQTYLVGVSKLHLKKNRGQIHTQVAGGY